MFRKAKEAFRRPGGSKTPRSDSELELVHDFGLHLIHDPGSIFSVDIIFVHGFGHPMLTWCKDGNPELFWPSKWLPLDSELAKARTFSFGYDASFKSTQSLKIPGIAEDLIDHMRRAPCLMSTSPAIGSVPVVFVAFSIGGLIVKEAHTIGLMNKMYYDMTRQVAGVVFLAAPHRGDGLDKSLRWILQLSGMTPKAVDDMIPSAASLESINYQFRHVATTLSIWSFYEDLPSKLNAYRSVMLDRHTSTLGWPGEHAFALAAPHYEMCKFASPDDGNYLQVLGGLKRVVRQVSRGQLSVYKPLSFEKIEIRIISIAQATDDVSFISCSLEQIPLYQAPPYVALSYCWGDLLHKVPIALNRQEIGITSNLYAAMLRLRERKIEHIWVDALCINQEDKEERSIQIGRMAAIYKQAKEVVIWLGELEGLSEGDLAPLSEVDIDKASATALDTCSAAIFQLLSRDYWSRVWIVQELAAASQITLLCGSFNIPWQTTCRLLDLDHGSQHKNGSMPQANEVKTRFEKISSFRKDKLARKPITLVEALWRTRHALSTDPKDKLYALLGLAYDSTNFIPHPNYNLTKEEVYMRFTIALLENGYAFGFITLRSATRETSGTLPSWAVDWSDLNDDLAKFLFEYFMEVDPSQQAIDRYDWAIDGDVLTVKGLLLGHVGTLRTPPKNFLDTAQNGSVDKSAAISTVSCTTLCLVPTISKLVSEAPRLLQTFKADSTFPPAPESAINTDIARKRLQHRHTDMARRLEIQEWFKVMGIQFMDIGGSHKLFKDIEWDEVVDLLIDLVKLGMEITFHDGANGYGAVHSDGASVLPADSNCAMGTVLGLLPNKARAGDLVVWVRGHGGAVVLREASGGYQVVGWAYLFVWSGNTSFENLDGWQHFKIV